MLMVVVFMRCRKHTTTWHWTSALWRSGATCAQSKCSETIPHAHICKSFVMCCA